MKLYCANARPFIYAAFSQTDADTAVPVLEKLAAQSVEFWYGFDDRRAEYRRLEAAHAVLLFISRAFIAEPRAQKLVRQAVAHNKNILCVYLEPVALPPGLAMQLGSLQALERASFKSDDAFFDKLRGAEIFSDMKLTSAQRRFQRDRGILSVAMPIAAAALVFFAVVYPLLIAPRAAAAQTMDSLGLQGLTKSDLASITELHIVGDRVYDGTVFASYDDNGLLQCEAQGTQESGIPLGTISDLSALAQLPNLEVLELEGQQISDITPLFSLTKLRRLVLNCNPVSDLTGIAALSNLEDLLLTDTHVRDLSPVANMPKLRMLQVSNTYVRDIGVVSTLQKLDTLMFDNTYVTDWSPIAAIPVRQGVSYSLSMRQIEGDVSVLAALPEYNELTIDGGDKAVVLSALEGKSISQLMWAGSRLTSIEELGGIEGVKLLHLPHDAYLTTLAGIEHFPQLVELKLVDCPNIDTLEPLLSLKLLYSVTISEDMRGLADALGETQFKIEYSEN
ncbi:MAG: hypothetical protein VB092_00155 [Oscillospiraceae bacterium]|nr:hypothetical protein [Oscillospiraceae bacterium]